MKKDDIISLLWLLALIIFVRVFVVEPFKIPSGSMKPTLLIGDHLFVAKSSYDIRVPYLPWAVHVAEPKRGDVVVFEYPNHEHDENKDGQYYIKRLVGLPGDKIEVRQGIPIINGVKVDQNPGSEVPGPMTTPQYNYSPETHKLLHEVLPSMDHWHWVQRNRRVMEAAERDVQLLKARSGQDCMEIASSLNRQQLDFYSSDLLSEVCPFVVPEGQYFMMGDNRDESADSRAWGFVERRLLKGRALFIWMSLGHSIIGNAEEPGYGELPPEPFFRWSRFGLKIK